MENLAEKYTTRAVHETVFRIQLDDITIMVDDRNEFFFSFSATKGKERVRPIKTMSCYADAISFIESFKQNGWEVSSALLSIRPKGEAK